MSRNVLLLSGSHRGENATSNIILNYLEEKTTNSNIIYTYSRISSLDFNQENEIFEKIDKADLIILCTPKYILTLPSNLILLFEKLFKRKSELRNKTRKFAVILQFEAPKGGKNAIKICKYYSDKMCFKWEGGLIIPGVNEINGRPLKETGSQTKNIRKALELTGNALNKGESIPKKAIKLAAKQFPEWLIILIVNWLIKKYCKKNKININKKPYENKHGLWNTNSTKE